MNVSQPMFAFLKKFFTPKPSPPQSKLPAKAEPPKQPQPVIVSPPTLPTIRKGDDSETVKLAQRKLKENGFFDYFTASGVFGEGTEKAVIHFQQTHIGEDGKPLYPDGVVGKKTWWALYNPSGPGQRQGIGNKAERHQDIIPHGLSQDRLAVLEQALLLYVAPTREVPDGSNTGDGVTKFHDWFGMKPAPWCAMAFCWIVNQAIGRLPWNQKQAHVATLWRLCKSLGMSKPIGSDYSPRPGDGFVMVRANDTGHIGIVVRVSTDGRFLDVFEGNSGNRFALRRRRVGQGDHVGYINFYRDEKTALPFARGLTGEAEAGTNQTR